MILDEIVGRTLSRVAMLPEVTGIPIAGPPGPGRLQQAIRSVKGRNAIIAEIKYSSPSAGCIRSEGEPEELCRMMTDGGAVALSVLTEPFWFHGSTENISRVRKVSGLPLATEGLHHRQTADHGKPDARGRRHTPYCSGAW